MNISKAFEAVQTELLKATEKFGPFASQHEGYAVILEELDELWVEIKHGKYSQPARIRAEAIQVAAMAVRFLMDCCEEDTPQGAE